MNISKLNNFFRAKTFSQNKRRHIHMQIIKNQLILSIVAILVIYFSTFYLSYFTMMRRTSQYLDENLHYINNQFDTFFEVIEEKWEFINMNQDIRSFLVYHNQFHNRDNIKLDESIQSEIKYFLDSNLNIFNLNQIIITDYQKKLNPIFILKDEIWYKDFISNNYRKHIYTDQIPKYYFTSEKVISYVFGLYNFTETELIGFAKFNIPYDIVENFLDTKISSYTPILIIDNSGKIVYSSVKDQSFQDQIVDIIPRVSKEKKVLIDNKYYLINKDFSKYTNWTAVSIISIDEELKEITNFALVLLPIILFIILVNILISFNTSIKIVKPINDLIQSIKMAEKGDFNQYVITDTKLIEISELASSYSEMIKEINNLVEKNHKINLLKIESELNALQQQINPHFLFNTLELISSQAILEGADSTSIMTQKLGNLFRYNLKSNDIITIKDELNYINDYLYLQKIRFDDELKVTYEIDNSILGYQIPKLTLQPIVENTIKHGFGELGSLYNEIIIAIRKTDANILISLEDNGIGILPEKLEQINKSLEADISNFRYFINRKDHIGLRNVNARICLLYKIERSLYISSSHNKGTTVTLRLPLK